MRRPVYHRVVSNRYRLERLRSLRAQVRRERTAELGMTMQQLDQARAALAASQAVLERVHARRNAGIDTAATSAAELVLVAGYRARLHGELLRAQTAWRAAAAEVERCEASVSMAQGQLVAAHLSSEAIERHRARWQLDRQRMQQRRREDG